LEAKALKVFRERKVTKVLVMHSYKVFRVHKEFRDYKETRAFKG